MLRFAIFPRSYACHSDAASLVSAIFKANMAFYCENGENARKLKSLFVEAVGSVQPEVLIKNQIKFGERHLTVNGESFELPKACHVVGFGKAVLGMALELERALGNSLKRAIVSVPKGIFENRPNLKNKSEKIQFMEGAENNIPDNPAMEAAEKIKELAEKLDSNDLLIVLISGGGSALLPLPKPPISLEEKREIITKLSRGGASIQELNTVRKRLSVLKGGGLARVAHPAKVISLILSDVVGDPLDIIASGPTYYSDETSHRAIEILKKYSLYDSAAVSIKTVLESGSGDAKLDNVSNFIIGNNEIATGAAKREALKMGWQCVVVSHKVEEDVNKLAEIYAQLALNISGGKYMKVRDLLENVPFELEKDVAKEILGLYGCRRILLIFAGEPTVRVKGGGKGGRNQQLALAFALQLNKQAETSGNISLLSAGTDGIDGPTDAAGAVGFSGLPSFCVDLDINPESYLENNDSYGFFGEFLNGEFLVKIGHTGTNVMDLHFLLIDPCSKQ